MLSRIAGWGRRRDRGHPSADVPRRGGTESPRVSSRCSCAASGGEAVSVGAAPPAGADAPAAATAGLASAA